MERTVAQMETEKQRRRIAFAWLVEDALDRLGSTDALVTRRLKRFGFWDDARPHLALGRYLDFVFGVSFIIDWFGEDKVWRVIPGSAAMYEDKFGGMDINLPGIIAHLNRWGLVEVSVTELYVECSYPIRPGAAASDCCRSSANTAVIDPNTKNLLYRCPRHRGKVRPGLDGRVVTTVKRPPSD